MKRSESDCMSSTVMAAYQENVFSETIVARSQLKQILDAR